MGRESIWEDGLYNYNSSRISCVIGSPDEHWLTKSSRLEQESTIDTAFWAEHCGSAPDEWTFCTNLGSQCGPVLTQRYATFITTSDIDTRANAGVTILRIPTTYAAWV
jgi:hypothetical protein